MDYAKFLEAKEKWIERRDALESMHGLSTEDSVYSTYYPRAVIRWDNGRVLRYWYDGRNWRDADNARRERKRIAKESS